MSEGSDFVPANYGDSHDSFASARSYYTDRVAKSASQAKAANKTIKDLLPQSLTTQCLFPCIIVPDGTGSMTIWPSVMFGKTPYFDNERKEYLGADAEVSFATFGDAHCGESYPLQAQAFTKGAGIRPALDALVYEKGGGGQGKESSDLALLYYARNVSMPNAIKPIIIIITDEKPWPSVTPSMAKTYAHVDLKESITIKQIVQELKDRGCVIYVIQKPADGYGSDFTEEVHEYWSELIGGEHICPLDDPDRVVDVIFGIWAQEMDMVAYFKKEIEDRQSVDQVKVTYHALESVHSQPAKPLLGSGKSQTHKPIGGKAAKALLPPKPKDKE